MARSTVRGIQGPSPTDRLERCLGCQVLRLDLLPGDPLPRAATVKECTPCTLGTSTGPLSVGRRPGIVAQAVLTGALANGAYALPAICPAGAARMSLPPLVAGLALEVTAGGGYVAPKEHVSFPSWARKLTLREHRLPLPEALPRH